MKINNFSDYQKAYKTSVETPEKFWEDVANEFYWRKKWDKTLEWNFNDFSLSWFVGAKLNITENIFERNFIKNQENPQDFAQKTAIIWEANDPNEPNITLSYAQLFEKVCQFANALTQNGIKKGDRIAIYMPMLPETVIAMLACARVGAIHSVVFAGFSASSLADRINDAQVTMVLTSDGNFRGAKAIEVKSVVDEAVLTCPSIKKIIVLKRTNTPVVLQEGRDIWWSDAISNANVSKEHQATEMDAEDPLFILYTSGSTGKPKGVVHTTAGYMVYTAYTFENVFQCAQNDIFWCTADVGWVTGHSYIVYAPLLCGATMLMFEGVPTYPDVDRFWQIIDKHKVTHLYTAPTAIRALMAFGTEPPKRHNLSSLKVLGSVGEPINEEAWQWYNVNIGGSKCPIVDTWWQTETGGILISPLAGITPTKPTFATLPLPGIQPILVDSEGKELLGNDVEGNLCIKFPFPSMLRTTYGDHERCKQTYFSTYKGLYFTGDGAKRDADGYYRILGRVDDVINVSGHRFGTAEIENAINEDVLVLESAVVGYPHDIKGQGIYAYVILDNNYDFSAKNLTSDAIKHKIINTVTKIIGAIAKPDKIQIVSGLPKTRSGKIMRRILRKIAEKDTTNLGDISTLLDPNVVAEIVEGAKNI